MAGSEERRAERDPQSFNLLMLLRGGQTKVSGGRPTVRRKHKAALHPKTPGKPQLHDQMQVLFSQRGLLSASVNHFQINCFGCDHHVFGDLPYVL